MQFRHVIATSVLGVCCAWPVWSQDAKSAQKTDPGRALVIAQIEKVAKPEKTPSPRLPNNFGKLELSDAQKDQIYAAQARYNGQIDVLEEQIKSLKEKRDAEIEKVLSLAQKQKLKTLQTEPKKKKDDKAEKEAPEKPKAAAK